MVDNAYDLGVPWVQGFADSLPQDLFVMTNEAGIARRKIFDPATFKQYRAMREKLGRDTEIPMKNMFIS